MKTARKTKAKKTIADYGREWRNRYAEAEKANLAAGMKIKMAKANVGKLNAAALERAVAAIKRGRAKAEAERNGQVSAAKSQARLPEYPSHDDQIDADNETYGEETPTTNPYDVSTILREAADLSEKKRADYAGDDPDENFIRAAKFAGIVCDGIGEIDPRRATVTLIGTKLARLMNVGLVNSAMNETISDTLTDLINYTAILKRQQARAAAGELDNAELA
jgi:hypothetical protein